MKHRARLFLFLLTCSVGVTPLLSGCGARQAQPIWNLPALIGKPIDVVKSTLGPEVTEMDLGDQMQTLWKTSDVSLSISWKKASRRVTAFEIISREDSGAVREGETSSLLIPGQLKENDPAYRVEWIEAKDRPLYYVGAKAIPAPQNHKVVLKASGSSALVNIAYSISGAGGKSETLMTIPPWQATFDLPDDSHVAFAGTLFKRVDQTPFELKLEIEVDGKVIKVSEATAGGANCELDL